jgi:hypothetical protein
MMKTARFARGNAIFERWPDPISRSTTDASKGSDEEAWIDSLSSSH